jgi:hypothetical protein
MRNAPVSLALLLVLCGCGVACNAQNSIADSHIEANVPKGELFDRYLKRDLTSYFCRDAKECRVDYELLRKGPTQTGISYPKYYLWVRHFSGQQIVSEGAVRIAAIDQSRFEITRFLSAKEILASKDEVRSIFPAPLVSNIIERAQGK